MSTRIHAETLLRGFDSPVDDCGRVFRTLLDAISHPGRIVPASGPAEHPDTLSDSASAVLLTLCDYTTPVWLEENKATREVTEYLRFHAAAPLASESSRAAFAVLGGGTPLTPERFFRGTSDYPDRAATVIVDVAGFEIDAQVRLSGPGINGVAAVGAVGLPSAFWEEMQNNNAAFPLGIDVILTAPGQLCAIPRSTSIEVL